MSKKSSDITAELRHKYNNPVGFSYPFLWLVDSKLDSESIAGIDLPATLAIIMTTQMSLTAQKQLAGRSVRRTPQHILPVGVIRPEDKMVIMLNTTARGDGEAGPSHE